MTTERPQAFTLVALTRDLPLFGLTAGATGMVIDVEDEGRVAVEFFDREGGTLSILSVGDDDVRLATVEDQARTAPEPLPPGAHVLIADATRSAGRDQRLSHIDAAGNARMVDVTAKDETLRVATARGRIVMQAATLRLLLTGEIAKGNVLTTAQVAGVMAAKRTHELIPMCHPLLLTGIAVELTPDTTGSAVEISATVRTTGKTGVEMEALTAVTVAALTVYDMCKAVDRGMRVEAVRVVHKSGGASGDWQAD